MPANGCSANETNWLPISSHSKKWETAQYKPVHVSEGPAPQASASALFKIHQRKRPA